MSRFDAVRKRRGVWISGMVIATGLSIVVTGILLLFVDRISVLILGGSDYTTLLSVFLLAIPLLTTLKITVGGIRGEENTIYRTYSQDLAYPISRIGLLGLLFLLGTGVIATAIAYVGGALIALMIALYLLNRLVSLNRAVDWRFRDLVVFSAPLIVSMVMSILLTRTDTIMVGYFRTSTEAGLYSAAYPVAGGLLLVLGSFGFFYLPLASRLDADDSRDEAEAVYELTTKWIYTVTFPAFAIFLLFPDQVLTLFWGDSYSEAGLSLSILSLGFFSSAAAGRNRETITAFGYTKFVMYANVIAFVINFLLNLVLVPRYGYIGASVSSAVSFAALNLFVYVVLRKYFGVTPFSKYSSKVFVALPIVVLPSIAAFGNVFRPSGLLVLAMLPPIGILSLLVAIAVGGLQPEDEIAILFIEERLSIKVPYVRNWISQ